LGKNKRCSKTHQQQQQQITTSITNSGITEETLQVTWILEVGVIRIGDQVAQLDQLPGCTDNTGQTSYSKLLSD